VELLAIDNGIGISEENVSRIFEMFFRATSLSTGSGLGLYIVKETIEKLGGTIEVNAALGQGTSFKMILPNIVS
jgi:signal transduction histidine kinase